MTNMSGSVLKKIQFVEKKKVENENEYHDK